MTQDEIMELVRQAGGTFGSHIAWVERDLMPVYIRFAHLVAEKEREACAAICDELHKARVGKDNYFAFAANAIRELRAKQ